MMSSRKKRLAAIYNAALDAVDPRLSVLRHLSLRDSLLWIDGRVFDLDEYDRVLLFGAGKGAAPMAQAVEEILGDRLAEGMIAVKYHHGLKLRRTVVLEAGHPFPDEAGLAASSRILSRIEKAAERDLILFVITGGASALLPAPEPPVDLDAKQKTTRILLQCGAAIDEINAVRKHLSRSKGGKLARAAHPAASISLVMSDVVGDPLDAIASGPTVPDTSTFDDCTRIVRRYGLEDLLPSTVVDLLAAGAAGRIAETPRPGDPIFENASAVVVGCNMDALLAARDKAIEMGYETLILTSRLQGEAREAGRVLAAIGREIESTGRPVAPPACILAGGETTVTIRGKGTGGRCQELALAAALDLKGSERISILSAGTDGTDGPTDAAGAFADGSTCAEALDGPDPRSFLDENDSYTFFSRKDDLFVTGPTRTNVMDLICLLVD